MPIAGISLLIPILTTLGEAVVNQYISSDVASKYAGMAFRVVNSVNTAEINLQLLGDDMEAKIAAAKESGETWIPPQTEIDAIWAQIKENDNAWANLEK